LDREEGFANRLRGDKQQTKNLGTTGENSHSQNRFEPRTKRAVAKAIDFSLLSKVTLFRQHEPLSFVDACIVAYMQRVSATYMRSMTTSTLSKTAIGSKQ
jgi:hypothetical protein